MRAKQVYEFHKGNDPLKALGLGPVTIELDNYNLQLDKNGKPIMNEDTEYFFRVCKDNNIHWKILRQQNYGNMAGPVTMRFTATKDNLIPLLVLFDAYGRDEDELRENLSDWDGSEYQLANIIF